ncbi:MAG TPA: hypothetical protein VJ843_04650 [Candidatus Saccharimonadales bacterium]|nr:hypothetical protein [Candidatus Saccharimonadales bacterium]
MAHDILPIVLLLAPPLVFTLLRINAVLVFLSLCLGDVLVKYVASDANSLLTLFAPGVSGKVTSFIQVVVLCLPVVLTSVFMVLSVQGRVRIITNILPALGVGFLGVLLVVPLLPPELRQGVQQGHVWPEILKLQSLIVGVSAVVSILFLWTQRTTIGHQTKHHSK